MVAFSDVDQDTGANSPLVRSDYENDPTRNYLPIAFREVGALRVSTTYERDFDESLLTVAPYYRDDSMDLLASFTLNFDPTLSRTANRSFGVMAKWRRDFDSLDARLIGGLDVDWSPGERREDRVLDRAHRLGRVARLHRLHAGRSRLRLRRHLPRRLALRARRALADRASCA